jgi:hypothetical protein
VPAARPHAYLGIEGDTSNYMIQVEFSGLTFLLMVAATFQELQVRYSTSVRPSAACIAGLQDAVTRLLTRSTGEAG